MQDLTPIMEAVALLVAAVVSTVIIPYIKRKTTTAQQEEINSWVRIAVFAAEQIFCGSGRGEEKKKYVLDFLAERNLKLDEVRLEALIEAAVYEMKNGIIKTA